MITENEAIKAGVLTAAATMLGTTEIATSSGLEMSLVLWLVGGLLSIIALLLAAICYFIRDMKNNNVKEHGEIHKSANTLNERLSTLEGQHNTAFQLRGCAYDPELLKDLVREAVKNNG
jgi:beta-lactamase regulating signal transducer with metallopeptidase domain